MKRNFFGGKPPTQGATQDMRFEDLQVHVEAQQEKVKKQKLLVTYERQLAEALLAQHGVMIGDAVYDALSTVCGDTINRTMLVYFHILSNQYSTMWAALKTQYASTNNNQALPEAVAISLRAAAQEAYTQTTPPPRSEPVVDEKQEARHALMDAAQVRRYERDLQLAEAKLVAKKPSLDKIKSQLERRLSMLGGCGNVTVSVEDGTAAIVCCCGSACIVISSDKYGQLSTAEVNKRITVNPYERHLKTSSCTKCEACTPRQIEVSARWPFDFERLGVLREHESFFVFDENKATASCTSCYYTCSDIHGQNGRSRWLEHVRTDSHKLALCFAVTQRDVASGKQTTISSFFKRNVSGPLPPVPEENAPAPVAVPVRCAGLVLCGVLREVATRLTISSLLLVETHGQPPTLRAATCGETTHNVGSTCSACSSAFANSAALDKAVCLALQQQQRNTSTCFTSLGGPALRARLAEAATQRKRDGASLSYYTNQCTRRLATYDGSPATRLVDVAMTCDDPMLAADMAEKAAMRSGNVEEFYKEMIKNASRGKGARWSKPVKDFFLHLGIVGGKIAAETVAAHFGGPSADTLKRDRQKYVTILEPGLSLSNFQAAYNFYAPLLSARGRGPRTVALELAEDETFVKNEVVWQRGHLHGFCGHKDRPGIPHACVFDFQAKCETPQDMAFAFENFQVATAARAIIINPLDTSLPPFCVALMATCMRFTGQEVRAQWDKINECWEESKLFQLLGVLPVGHSSDGASTRRQEQLKKARTGTYGLLDPTFVLRGTVFEARDGKEHVWEQSQQDPIHNVKKLINASNSQSKQLAFGDGVTLQLNQIGVLLANGELGVDHGLRRDDITRRDRQNYESAERVAFPAVRDALKKHEEAAHQPGRFKGIITFLLIVSMYIDVYFSKHHTFSEKVQLCSTVYHFLLMWRAYCVKQSTVSKAFLSNAAYLDMMLSLCYAVNLMRWARDYLLPQAHLHLQRSGSDCVESHFSRLGSFFDRCRVYTFYQALLASGRMNTAAQLVAGGKVIPRHQKTNRDTHWEKAYRGSDRAVVVVSTLVADIPGDDVMIQCWVAGRADAEKLALSVGLITQLTVGPDIGEYWSTVKEHLTASAAPLDACGGDRDDVTSDDEDAVAEVDEGASDDAVARDAVAASYEAYMEGNDAVAHESKWQMTHKVLVNGQEQDVHLLSLLALYNTNRGPYITLSAERLQRVRQIPLAVKTDAEIRQTGRVIRVNDSVGVLFNMGNLGIKYYLCVVSSLQRPGKRGGAKARSLGYIDLEAAEAKEVVASVEYYASVDDTDNMYAFGDDAKYQHERYATVEASAFSHRVILDWDEDAGYHILPNDHRKALEADAQSLRDVEDAKDQHAVHVRGARVSRDPLVLAAACHNLTVEVTKYTPRDGYTLVLVGNEGHTGDVVTFEVEVHETAVAATSMALFGCQDGLQIHIAQYKAARGRKGHRH